MKSFLLLTLLAGCVTVQALPLEWFRNLLPQRNDNAQRNDNIQRLGTQGLDGEPVGSARVAFLRAAPSSGMRSGGTLFSTVDIHHYTHEPKNAKKLSLQDIAAAKIVSVTPSGPKEGSVGVLDVYTVGCNITSAEDKPGERPFEILFSPKAAEPLWAYFSDDEKFPRQPKQTVTGVKCAYYLWT